MFSSLCVVSLWRNSTVSMHILTRKDQWVTKHHRENNNNKKTKIPVSMGSQHHKENNKQQDFSINDSGSQSLILIFVVFFFGFLYGFGYPLVLKSCFLMFFVVVFFMVLVTH